MSPARWRRAASMACLLFPLLVSVALLPWSWSAVAGGAVVSLVFAGPLLTWLHYGFGGHAGTVLTCLFGGWLMVAGSGFAVSNYRWVRFDRIDVLVIYPVGAFVLMLVAVAVGSAARRGGTVQPRHGTAWQTGIAVLALTVTVLVGLVSWVITVQYARMAGKPMADEVPLPPGVTVLAVDNQCESSEIRCTRALTVVGRGGPESTVAEISAHWRRLGWNYDAVCTVKGWLAPSRICWSVGTKDDDVQVVVQQLAGATWWPSAMGRRTGHRRLSSDADRTSPRDLP